jgi:hypothetical protein
MTDTVYHGKNAGIDAIRWHPLIIFEGPTFFLNFADGFQIFKIPYHKFY